MDVVIVVLVAFFFCRRYYQEVNRELYICCRENVSQSTVEIAFKLLFGWPG